VVPHGAPPLLFNQCGVNQFKDVFLGLKSGITPRRRRTEMRGRAAEAQRPENVGFTSGIQTFFESWGIFVWRLFQEGTIGTRGTHNSPDWFNILRQAVRNCF